MLGQLALPSNRGASKSSSYMGTAKYQAVSGGGNGSDGMSND
jgi:hypothetical protein